MEALADVHLSVSACLCSYRHGPRAGLCDIPYDATTLEWFPDENTYEDFPLPQNELPMFCFPRGLFLKVRDQVVLRPRCSRSQHCSQTIRRLRVPPSTVPQHQKRDDAPMPSYFSFVFTSIDGDRVHVACLQFYELLPDRVLKSLQVRHTACTHGTCPSHCK